MKSGYGIEQIYLEHANLPNLYPFLPGYDHGLSLEDIPSKNTTLNHLSNIYLCWGERVFNNLKILTKKTPYISGAPFVIYKKKNNILKDSSKKTLFFPSHSTDKISQNLNVLDIHKMISEIDAHFKPIDICLHWKDYKRDKKKYEDFGYNVYTAGKIFSNSFMKNFYNILKNYEYSMSNKLGTYILYSVDLGIPFSLVGQEPIYYNHSHDKNKPSKYKVTDYEYGRIAKKLFFGLNTFISNDQKKFVLLETGSNKIISPKMLNSILREEFQKSLTNSKGIKNIFKFYAKSSYISLFR